MIDQERIHDQCISWNSKEKIKGLEQLEDNFSLLPNQKQALRDLYGLTIDIDNDISYKATLALSSLFSQMPYKQQAWRTLISYALEINYRRYIGSEVLGLLFSQVPNKQQAWDELIMFATSEHYAGRFQAAEVLCLAFPICLINCRLGIVFVL